MSFVYTTYFADTNNYFRNYKWSFTENIGNNVRSNLNYSYWKSRFCFSLLSYQYPWQPAIYLVWTAPPEKVELFCVLSAVVLLYVLPVPEWYFTLIPLDGTEGDKIAQKYL